MIIEQKSLKEYDLTSSSGVVNITISKYINGEFVVDNTYATISNLPYNEDNSIDITETTSVIIFVEDGIYKITEPGNEYIINNITNLLKIRQVFLTKALNEYIVDRCNTNQYVDYCTFTLLFDSYIDLFETTFDSKFFSNKNLNSTFYYKLDYLYSQLMKYKI